MGDTVIVRNVLKAGDRYVGELKLQAPTSALVELEGNPEGAEGGVWVSERNIDRITSAKELDNGAFEFTFESGVRLIEGSTNVLPAED